MLRFIKSYTQLPVLSIRSGSTIAHVQSPIIDPKKLQIVAFWVKDSRSQEDLILLISDIREHVSRGLVINDFDSLAEPGDLIRMQELIKLAFDPVGMHVENQRKSRLGKVADFAIDHQSYYIQRIHYKAGLIRGLGGDLSFARTQVIEITNRKFVIKDADIKESVAKKLKLRPAMPNPAYSGVSSMADRAAE